MTDSVDPTQYLNAGIEAARAGKKQEARKYLRAVLRADANHVPALFWLAFVAPSPEESIRLLERVLALEPGNARAKAGLEWARRQLPPADSPAVELPPAVDPPPLIDRQQLFDSQEGQTRAQKGRMAQRARRTINPLLAVLLLLGGAALIVAGIWAVAFVPPDTLAAWLPVSTGQPAAVAVAASDTQPVAVGEPPAPGKIEPVPVEAAPPPSLTVAGDTIKLPVQMREMPVETLTVPDASLLLEPVQVAPVSAAAPPELLLGPDKDAAGGPKLLKPVDASLLAYQPASPTEKWIEVNLTQQRVTAWEGNIPVMTFLSSTGLPGTPTVQGQYNIYWKLESTLMSGPGYYLPDVAYTMYFYAGYALHGAYWHENFGQPMSHGCVNLSNDNAKALFEWAGPVIPPGQTQVEATADNPGTLVVVHE